MAHGEEYVRLSAYYYGDRPAFCFQVPLERVRHLPTWVGAGKAPPLSRAQAIRIAARELRVSAAPDRVELDHVNAQFSGFSGDVWYYLVEYGPTEKSGLAVAAVLFDGKLAETRTEGDCTEFFR